MDETKTQGARLAVIEEILARLEKSNQTSFDSLFAMVRDIKSDFQSHLIETAATEQKLVELEKQVKEHTLDIAKLKEMDATVKTIQQTNDTAKKIVWELAKPIMYVIGVAFVLLIGMVGVLMYNFGTILSVIKTP